MKDCVSKVCWNFASHNCVTIFNIKLSNQSMGGRVHVMMKVFKIFKRFTVKTLLFCMSWVLNFKIYS